MGNNNVLTNKMRYHGASSNTFTDAKKSIKTRAHIHYLFLLIGIFVFCVLFSSIICFLFFF